MSALDDYASTSRADDSYRAYEAPSWNERLAPRPAAKSKYLQRKHLRLVEAPKKKASVRAENSDALARQFKKLAGVIEDKYSVTAFFRDIHTCDEYLTIIGMGPDVVPLLLADLRANGRPWFVALRAITRAKVGDAVQPGNLRELAAAWIEWGEKRGYL